MNVAQQFTRRNLACALGVMVVEIATLFAPCLGLAQTGSASPYDPLESLVGTWTAKNPGESNPCLTLKLTEKDGKLIGMISHFKFRVIGSGKLIGILGTPGETPISNPTVTSGDLSFGWSEDAPFPGARAELAVEGTQVARLVFLVPAEQIKKIMAENPEASGFNPGILVRRESKSTRPEPGGAGGTTKQSRDSVPNWRVALMARVTNKAEVQYKFAHGRYADYATLVRSGQLREAGRHFKVLPGNLQSETEPLPGYELRLLIAPDSGTYQLSIQKKMTAGCGPAVFSDERGVIFEGHNPNCPPD